MTKDSKLNRLQLEIGTGSGYAAAVMSRIVADVYTIEGGWNVEAIEEMMDDNSERAPQKNLPGKR